MRFLPAEEDFVLRTLAAVEGRWSKLQYMASLREADGTYRHWGLARVYGEETAGRVIAGAHEQVFLDVLRTPLRDLWSDVRHTAEGRSAAEGDFVRELQEAGATLAPRQFGGGSMAHFNSVLEALAALAGRQSSRRSA